MKTTKTIFLFILSLLFSYQSIGQWETVYYPFPTIDLPWLKCVSFKDCKNGIAAGSDWWGNESYIIKTSNSGTDWDTVLHLNDNIQYTEIKFRSNRIITTGSDILLTQGAISVSNDDGTTWNTNYYSNSSLGELSMPSDLVAYVGGSNGILLKTVNGGNMWNPVTFPNTNFITSINFINNDTGFVSADTSIYKTINGGNTWTTINLDLEKIHFPSSNVGYGILTKSINNIKLFKTSDFGNSWNFVSYIPTSPDWVQDLLFLNDSLGYAIGFTFVLKTLDGGISWIRDSVYVDSFGYVSFFDDIYDFDFVDDSTLFIIGLGQFYRTNDCSLTGYDERHCLSSNFTVYPNPFTHSISFSINTDYLEKVNLQIVSITGEVVYEQHFTTNTPIIVQQVFDKGLYFAQIRIGEQTEIIKIIKQ